MLASHLLLLLRSACLPSDTHATLVHLGFHWSYLNGLGTVMGFGTLIRLVGHKRRNVRLSGHAHATPGPRRAIWRDWTGFQPIRFESSFERSRFLHCYRSAPIWVKSSVWPFTLYPYSRLIGLASTWRSDLMGYFGGWTWTCCSTACIFDYN